MISNRPVPANNYDLPDTLHGDFWVMGQGICDFVTDAFPIGGSQYGTLLTINTSDGAIYVSKAQAMAFFGLVEPTTTA